MSKLTPVNESNHAELMSLINPLIDFMQKNEYSFFLVAGKDGIATRQMLGKLDDLSGMIEGMMKNHPQVESLIKYTVECFEDSKNILDT
jgi:hypothetical protein